MQTFDFLKTIDRRTFLRIASITGLSGLIYPRNLVSSLVSTTTSRVVIVADNTATNGYTINKTTVQVMVDAAVKSLAQNATDVGSAWKSLLPEIKSSSTIAIKVNCINSSMPTHPEVTNAVVAGLQKMSFGGSAFPANNIIIFDRTNGELQASGYPLNTSSSGVRCFGTNSPGVGYSSQSYTVNGSSQKLSKIITEMADYLINIAVLKNHGTSGVTLCMKNHYGTCNNPGALHGSYGDPYIPALNALTPIFSKQKINICDALYGIKSGGPGGSPQFIANKIIMSQDIVAHDYQGRKLLFENGCSTVSRAHHIETAASNYNLGTTDPSKMEIVNISNPTTKVELGDNDKKLPADFQLEQNYPNPFNSQTQIRFFTPRSTEVQVLIFDTTGRRVRQLVNNTLGMGWHEVQWDGRNDDGSQVSSGVYICQMQANSFKTANIMQLLK